MDFQGFSNLFNFPKIFSPLDMPVTHLYIRKIHRGFLWSLLFYRIPRFQKNWLTPQGVISKISRMLLWRRLSVQEDILFFLLWKPLVANPFGGETIETGHVVLPTNQGGKNPKEFLQICSLIYKVASCNLVSREGFLFLGGGTLTKKDLQKPPFQNGAERKY